MTSPHPVRCGPTTSWSTNHNSDRWTDRNQPFVGCGSAALGVPGAFVQVRVVTAGPERESAAVATAPVRNTAAATQKTVW